MLLFGDTMSQELRFKLSDVMKDFWKDPATQPLRTQLSSQAVSSGYAKCLKELMKAGRAGKSAFEKCAEEKRITSAYRSAWGKPVTE